MTVSPSYPSLQMSARAPRPVSVLLAAWLAVASHGWSADKPSPNAAEPDSAGPLALSWPIDAEPGLTSGFAEQRPDHFHAGVDIKTWKGQGYAVRAAGDGHVWRIKTSPQGYGKALYLKLKGGLIVVYAHLLDFTQPIASFLEDEQWRQRRYSIDIYPPPDRLPIRAGEFIGRTGRSGCKAPHLHFELRNEENHPINPLTNGLVLPDHEHPVFAAIEFVPMDVRSFIDGKSESKIVALHRLKGQPARYAARDTVQISGTVGVAANVWDRACGLSNRLPLYRLALHVNDSLLYSSASEEFSYGETRQVDIEYDCPRYRRGEGSFRRLFRPRGYTLGFPTVEGDGLLRTGEGSARRYLAPGLHTLETAAIDASGNEARCAVVLLVNSPPQILACSVSRGRLAVLADDPETDSITVSLDISADRGRTWERMTLAREGAGNGWIEAAWQPPAPAESLLLARVQVSDPFDAPSHPVFRPVISSPLAEPEPGADEVSTEKRPTTDDPDETRPARSRRPDSSPRSRTDRVRQIGIWPPDRAPADTSEIGVTCAAEQIPPRLLLALRSRTPLAFEPELTVEQRGAPPRKIALHAEAANRYRGEMKVDPRFPGEAVVRFRWTDAWGRVGEGHTRFSVNGATREAGGVIISSDGLAEIRIDPGSLFSDLTALVESQDLPAGEGLRPASRAYEFGPDISAFARDATIAITPRPGWARADPRVAIYVQTDSGEWQFLGRNREGGRVTATIKRMGTYAALLDTVAPHIWSIHPTSGEVADAKTLVSFHTRDQGSGLTEEGINVELDGMRMVAEWDPFEQRVIAWSRGALSPGHHLLTIVVEDAAGNRSEVHYRFEGG
jgi:hypothetical protein